MVLIAVKCVYVMFLWRCGEGTRAVRELRYLVTSMFTANVTKLFTITAKNDLRTILICSNLSFN